MTLTSIRWFSTQVDRDYKTNEYGEGKPRLYLNSDIYKLITGVSYTNGLLIVKDQNDNFIELKNQPDNEYFANTIYADWKLFDERYGKYDENRIDYEPWAYNSLDALAIELGLYEQTGITMYYKKGADSG